MPDELKPVYEACKSVRKSELDDFSYNWLREAGNTFHHSMLKRLVALGYLAVNYNGIHRRGTAWYRLVAA